MRKPTARPRLPATRKATTALVSTPQAQQHRNGLFRPPGCAAPAVLSSRVLGRTISRTSRLSFTHEARTSPMRTRRPDEVWSLSDASIVTVKVGKSFGETPDQSVTRPPLELKVPIGTSVPAVFFNHAW